MKNILVTGAAGGMGSAACALLARKGYRIWGMDLKTGTIPDVHYIEADLTDSQSVKNAYRIVAEEEDHLDAIVHTAGIYDLNSLVEMGEKEIGRIFEVNMMGAYRVNKAFLPLLKEGSRVIITTSELAPLDPLPFTGIYAVTKAALDKYAYSLRMELNLLGIKVSVVRPGAVETGLLGVSTRALDRFCEETQIYRCNAVRFRKIVNRVEARSVSAERIAEVFYRAITAKRPRFIYTINRNPLLLLLNILPKRMQVWIIGEILKTK